MRIGVLGTGDVGRVLAGGLAQLGHDVKLGSRNANRDRVTFAEAATFAELAILATLWSGTENAIRLAGPHNLAGKVVIDTTNPLDFSAGMPPKLALGHTDSAGERVQHWLPRSKVVKAFNTVGNAHMVRPEFPGGPPDMFICGDDAQAKQTVSDLIQSLGWPRAIDLGGIECARYLEPMAMVWILYYFRTQSGNHAFRLLRK